MKRIFTLLSLLAVCYAVSGADYHFDAQNGDDSRDGLSPVSAFRTLGRLSGVALRPGDRIVLRSGQVHAGTIELVSVSGSEGAPITVTSSGTDMATLDARGHVNGILINNSSHIRIENLHIKADGGGMPAGVDTRMRCGVLVSASGNGAVRDISLSGLEVNDIYYEDPGFDRDPKDTRTPNGTQNYGYGIYLQKNSKESVMDGVTVEGCDVSRVSHTGIRGKGVPEGHINDVTLRGNTISHVGGPGVVMSMCDNSYFGYNRIDHSGSVRDSRNWKRGSCLWTWGAENILIEHNSFTYANGPADSAGAHIDFNCRNVVHQYNFSAYNAGGFIEVLGNNHNCCYRYNVSVNDGFRDKGVDGAMQEGKTLWLSGYAGAKAKRHGPYNTYVYNNTIYASADVHAKFAIENTAAGALIANNIFYVAGDALTVPGDQYRPEVAGESESRNIFLKNNLYLHAGSWPADNAQDTAPLLGDPGFAKPGGMAVGDYVPQNKKLVRQGVRIEPIPGDEVGLVVGLHPQYDILGNKIGGRPSIGAIQVK